jgi:hypothetical protein
MDDNNTLLQYKLEHFGKFYKNAPKRFSDLLEERGVYKYYSQNPIKDNKNFGIFPGDFDRMLSWEDRTKSYSWTDHSSFFRKSGFERFPKTIPLTKIDEYQLSHPFIGNTKQTIYQIFCVFPEDFIVPGQLRMIKYFAKAEWLEPFTAEIEFDDLMTQIKQKFGRKH